MRKEAFAVPVVGGAAESVAKADDLPGRVRGDEGEVLAAGVAGDLAPQGGGGESGPGDVVVPGMGLGPDVGEGIEQGIGVTRAVAPKDEGQTKQVTINAIFR
ncbi:hypothetical protein [Kitasatospora sp. NPDC057223]|uniref:hypothetical protein n=1 Tax=Kitasatospora sp. NPDC057223 TaxID=3346055 RepID=UPI00363FC94E